MPKERNKIIPACYLILFQDNKTLLLKRKNTGFQDGNYWLISGHVEARESFTQCMIREAQEEAGISIKPQDLNVVHVKNKKSNQTENSERLDVFFLVRSWTGEITNVEPEKCDDLSWFDLDHLPANTIPYIQNVLSEVKNNIFYSEEWF